MPAAIATDQLLIKKLQDYYANVSEDVTRQDLIKKYGVVWNDDELLKEFGVSFFDGPLLHVIKRSNGVRGTVAYITVSDKPGEVKTHLYFAFEPDSEEDRIEIK
jgi:hypothetical protein